MGLSIGLLTLFVSPAGSQISQKAHPAKTPEINLRIESGSAGFQEASPGYRWSFPRDTGSHPGYQTEWWYYTGHLAGPKGERFGYELTFFRSGLEASGQKRASNWGPSDLYFGHFAVTDISGRRFSFDERAARGALGLAGSSITSQNVWIEKWGAKMDGQTHRLKAKSADWKIDLAAIPFKTPALHGKHGYSQKGEGAGHASNYYSYTRLKTSGTLWKNGQPLRVTGESWMDHEFSTGSLAPGEVGWDWLSLQLDNGEDLMLYQMRRENGTPDPHSGGTWVARNGATQTLALKDYKLTVMETWKSPRTGAVYPAKWRITIPGKGLNITVTPSLADQELTTLKSTGVIYWEGAAEVEGALQGQPIHGQSYVELTGYGGSVQGKA